MRVGPPFAACVAQRGVARDRGHIVFVRRMVRGINIGRALAYLTELADDEEVFCKFEFGMPDADWERVRARWFPSTTFTSLPVGPTTPESGVQAVAVGATLVICAPHASGPGGSGAFASDGYTTVGQALSLVLAPSILLWWRWAWSKVGALMLSYRVGQGAASCLPFRLHVWLRAFAVLQTTSMNARYRVRIEAAVRTFLVHALR